MAQGRILEWKTLSGSDFAALNPARCVVMVSCSPLEVHGPHLPVMCDFAEADALSHRTMQILLESHPDLTFLTLPPVYAAADVLPHRGSVAFRPSTIVRVLEDLGRSLTVQGFRNVWVSNFHGGPRHFVAIEEACHRVNKKHGGRMVPVFSLLLASLTGGATDLSEILGPVGGMGVDILKGDAHGGAVETSMLLHLHGQHVKDGWQSLPQRTVELALEAAGRKPLQAGARPTLVELFRSFPIKLRYFEAETYAGAPAAASAEAGAKFVDTLGRLTADALSQVLNGTRAMKDCHSPLWPARHLLLNGPLGRVFDRLMATRPAGV